MEEEVKEPRLARKEFFLWVGLMATAVSALFALMSYAGNTYVSKSEFNQYTTGNDKLNESYHEQLKRIEDKLDKALDNP
jgi:hypothetical protein